MDKKVFIEHLAEFLVGNEAGKSVALQMAAENPNQKPPGFPKWENEWVALRSVSPLRGYTTKKEAIKKLTEFLK